MRAARGGARGRPCCWARGVTARRLPAERGTNWGTKPRAQRAKVARRAASRRRALRLATTIMVLVLGACCVLRFACCCWPPRTTTDTTTTTTTMTRGIL